MNTSGVVTRTPPVGQVAASPARPGTGAGWSSAARPMASHLPVPCSSCCFSRASHRVRVEADRRVVDEDAPVRLPHVDARARCRRPRPPARLVEVAGDAEVAREVVERAEGQHPHRAVPVRRARPRPRSWCRRRPPSPPRRRRTPPPARAASARSRARDLPDRRPRTPRGDEPGAMRAASSSIFRSRTPDAALMMHGRAHRAIDVITAARINAIDGKSDKMTTRMSPRETAVPSISSRRPGDFYREAMPALNAAGVALPRGRRLRVRALHRHRAAHQGLRHLLPPRRRGADPRACCDGARAAGPR